MNPASNEKLARENRRLRTALIAVLSAFLGAGVVGWTNAQQSKQHDVRGFAASDGYLYILQGSDVYRMNIDARTDYNRERPGQFEIEGPGRWNLFVGTR